MTFLLSAPERLVLMIKDATNEAHLVTDEFVESIDGVIRPAVLVEEDGGEYPPTASNLSYPTEPYTILVVGQNAGSDGNRQYQLEVRRITHAVVQYLMRHNQLQMSNERSLQPASLPSLAGVMHTHLRRGAVMLATRGAQDAFWGCEITLTIFGVREAMERIVT